MSEIPETRHRRQRVGALLRRLFAAPWASRGRQLAWVLLAFALPAVGLPPALGAAGHERWVPVSGLAAPGAVRSILAARIADQAVVYVVVEHWGIFQSGDGGLNWVAANRLPRGPLGRVDVLALALSPDDPRMLLAIVAERAAGGRTVYKTADGGRSWVPRRGLGAVDVESVAVGAGGSVYAAGGPHLLLSADGGDSWFESGSRPVLGRALTMAVDPGSGALFVGTSGHGLWSTADQGNSWCADLAGRSVYAVVLSERGRIYLGTQDGLHCSSDGGASWQRLPSPAVHGKVMALAIRSGSPDGLYVSIAGRPIQCSVDGGATWRSLQHTPPGANVTALAVDPLSPAHLYVGTDQGLWRCTLPADADSSASGQP